MKKVLVGLILGIFLISSVGYAAMPKYISVQGRLSDAEGPVSGAYDFYFKIDNDAAGCPSPVWYNERENINLDNGVFNILIGSSKAITDSFDGPRYLCIAVKKHGESSYDWFSTSVPVSSSGYAYTAQGADAFDVRNDLSVSGNAMVNGDLKVLTDSGFELIFTGSNDVNIQSPGGFYLYTSGATSNPGFSILANGNVGIGTATPGAKLDVYGGNGIQWSDGTVTWRLGRYFDDVARSGWVYLTTGSGGGYQNLAAGGLYAGTTLRAGYLPSCSATTGKLYTDADGKILCGTDQTGTGGTTGVTSFSAGSTGLTPNTVTTGAITLGGTLAVASGGTGATTVATARTNLGVDAAGTARPASDVYSWAKASSKPTYTYSEVGAAASSHTHPYLSTSGGTLTGALTVSSSITATKYVNEIFTVSFSALGENSALNHDCNWFCDQVIASTCFKMMYIDDEDQTYISGAAYCSYTIDSLGADSDDHVICMCKVD